MTEWLLGGVNEMVGIGCGIATIMMSSTPFWLVNTGGSASVSASAVPSPSPNPAARPAAPIHRRNDASAGRRRHAQFQSKRPPNPDGRGTTNFQHGGRQT